MLKHNYKPLNCFRIEYKILKVFEIEIKFFVYTKTLMVFCCFNFRSKPKKRNIIPVSKLLDSAKRCKVAYLDLEQLQRILNDSSIPLFKFIKRELGHAEKLKFLSNAKKDTQAYLWIKDKVCYLTFRGSSSTQDYMQNIKVLSVET